VAEPGVSDQWPNDRKPIFFIFMDLKGVEWEVDRGAPSHKARFGIAAFPRGHDAGIAGVEPLGVAGGRHLWPPLDHETSPLRGSKPISRKRDKSAKG
jgi:hypothetical protein